jgi:TatA/E family protein of Tat protein translocase
MEIFGIGPGELMLIMVLALIVFGPGKLPEIGQGMGKAIREFRKATSQITEEFTRELQLDAQPQEPRRPQSPPPQQSPAPQQPVQEQAPVAAESPSEPLVLEIKRPSGNGATVASQEVPSTVVATTAQEAVAKTPAAEAVSAEIASKPQRARKSRKPAADSAAEGEAVVTETPVPAKPRRRRKAADAEEPAQV